MNNTWREIIKFSLPLTFLGILDLLVVIDRIDKKLV